MHTEALFNSVEAELARRWAFADVPASLASRPVEQLQKIVGAWWEIYQESTSATMERSRTIWERNQDYPAKALDTPALIESLKQIRQLIDMEALSKFRDLHQAEHSAIGLLELIINFYVELNNQTSA